MPKQEVQEVKIKKKRTKKEEEILKEACVQIVLKSYDLTLLDGVVTKLLNIIRDKGSKASVVCLSTKKTKFTVLRAPFKYKDAREQFEIRTHRRLITITDIKEDLINVLRNNPLPGGIEIRLRIKN